VHNDFATTIYLVRHGQTAWNTEQRFQGQVDVPLDELGLRQAAAVADWLHESKVPFAAVFSSNLSRAAVTAGTIADRLGLAAVSSAALQEINCGDWAGMTVSEVERCYPGQIAEWHAHVDRFTLPGGENIPLVLERAGAYLKTVLAAHRGDSIVVVGHGMVLATQIIDLLQWNLVDVWQRSRPIMGNTGVAVLHWDGQTGRASMALYNAQAHLASLPASHDPWSQPGGTVNPVTA
jgi:alpha-ribazole phosphatase